MDVAALLELRQRREVVPFSHKDLPLDVEEAYAAAAQLVRSQGSEVVAWKLGATTAGTRATFATDVVYYGALLSTELLILPDIVPIDFCPFRGEAEIALRLGRDITPAEALDLPLNGEVFDAFAPAIECPWSVVGNLPQAGLPALLMDRCASGLLLLGRSRTFGRRSVDDLIEILVDGTVIAAGRASKALLMSPAHAAVLAMREMGAQGLHVRKGQWISTGGITECVSLPTDQKIGLRFGGELDFSANPRAKVGR